MTERGRPRPHNAWDRRRLAGIPLLNKFNLNNQLMFNLKKYDKLIILFSIAGIILSFIFLHKKADNKILVIYADDQRKIHTLDDADFTVKSKEGSVKVKIRNGKVKITESTCPDKWCTRMGWIDDPGESLVCLPSKIFLIIREEGKENNKHDGIDSVTR